MLTYADVCQLNAPASVLAAQIAGIKVRSKLSIAGAAEQAAADARLDTVTRFPGTKVQILTLHAATQAAGAAEQAAADSRLDIVTLFPGTKYKY